MRTSGVYSLKLERLYAERQQSVVRVLASVMTSYVLVKFYMDQSTPPNTPPGKGLELTLTQVTIAIALFMIHSLVVWALVKWRPEKLKTTVAVSSFVELGLIIYLVNITARTDLSFSLWYMFYVVSIATRYGLQYSIMAVSACIVSFVIQSIALSQNPLTMLVSSVLGFTSFLLILALLFGQISERQLNYQASLAIVNEFRAELAGLASSREIIAHMLARSKDLLHVEQTFFLPAKRGADASEAPGLRSAGADPALMSTFREKGDIWNVESVLTEQRPMLTNNVAKDIPLPGRTIAKLELKNLAVAPMMVRGVPVGVVYAANRRDKSLSNHDMQLLELIATQAAPVVENALLWERLREAAASEERLRIARDLHDNFLQTLAAIKLHLERCKILVQKDPDRALEGIDRIHQIATRGLAEVRTYLSELRLMGPEPSRFREAIEKCASDAASRGGFETEIDIKIPEEGIAPNVALAAFQILRELMNNAVSHSKAQKVCIKVDTKGGELFLEVEDNGKGFDVTRVRAEKASQGHLGLVGVEERARQSEGTFTLTSEPEKGTKAKVTLGL